MADEALSMSVQFYLLGLPSLLFGMQQPPLPKSRPKSARHGLRLQNM